MLMSAGATQRGALTLVRARAPPRADAFREREDDDPALRERGVLAAALRERDTVVPVERARVDDAPRPDPDRLEVDPLLVVTRFCVRAAAMGMRSVV